jgi:sugar lactone lactonase YvrE
VGRDQKRYGPLPREWAHYEGLYLHSGRAVIAASIGGTRVLESPGWIESAVAPVFTRTLNVGVTSKPLSLRVAPDRVHAALVGDGLLRKESGFWIAELPGGAKTRLFISRAEEASLAAIAKAPAGSLDLDPLTHGGPRRWVQEVTTTSVPGEAGGAFIADTLPLPTANPWDSWMRPGGFDFTPDGKAAIVATWNGDVWRVDGVMAAAPATLKWRRIASGLFQPLGVKFRGDELFILCRDQLVRLTDLNGDGEADFIESFNNDHQVTEHFHEFAMGLQVDGAGNFYYAKSGRHALDSVVPHHGTLLRVSPDGRRTDILATGFRAANGVCLNDDGTFFVTDQEGFWTPKNRINRVKVGGFYGNMFGYSSVTNTSDAAMEQPMVWITNAKDRSPAELVWVPAKVWGALGGSLLNLSYGTGRIFVVPHEEVGGQWQGAVCELPMPAFATGIMRGRFAADGALYACGLFGWAGNATAPGGFHRVRRTEKPAHVPIAIHAGKARLRLTFSDSIDPASVMPDAFAFKVWSLKRSADYGSKHYDERELEITAVSLDSEARTVTIEIPALAPTQCYELKLRLAGKSGEVIERSLHGTIHRLADE